ncbi:MAG TPA: cysteine rich repeat-containing protein [Rhizomicrobium sp.]|nr:cysteine rich repeat-containing protein [Rhizomicrobium sp.]
MCRNLVLAAALLLSFSPALAQSSTQQAPAPAPQTPAAGAHPQATPEVQEARKAMRQACREDAHTLCADTQAGGGKLMQCLRAHKDQVSAGCRSAFQHLRDVRKGA